MRITTAILLLTALASAQDGAARAKVGEPAATDLFYRAFWFEHAAGKTDEATAAYEKILREHDRAPEAPRALLGLIRIRVGRGKDAMALLVQLRKAYPDSAREIKQAGELVRGVGQEFSPVVRPQDTDLQRRLREHYELLMSGGADDEAIADFSVRAHPMLRYVMKHAGPDPVQTATWILAEQRSAAAYAVVIEALEDESLPHRRAVLSIFKETLAIPLVEGLTRVFPTLSPRLRYVAVNNVRGDMDDLEGETLATTLRFLAIAMKDADEAVRIEATPRQRDLGSWPPPERWTKEFALAVLDAAEKTQPSPYLCRLGAVDERRVTELVARVSPERFSEFPKAKPSGARSHRILATAVLELVEKHPQDRFLASTLRSSANPDQLVGWMIRTKNTRPLDELRTTIARRAFFKTVRNGSAHRRAAFDSLLREDSYAVRSLLSWLGLSASGSVEDLEASLKTAPHGKGIDAILDSEHGSAVYLFGGRAADLVRLCHDVEGYNQLFKSGSSLMQRGSAVGEKFFARLVSKVDARAYKSFWSAPPGPANSRVVLARLLHEKGAEWLWQTGEKPPALRVLENGDTQPHIWTHFASVPAVLQAAPFFAVLMKSTNDGRLEIALSAIEVAGRSRHPDATAAVIAALDSRWETVRAAALRSLKKKPRKELAAPLVQFLGRAKGESERYLAYEALASCGGREHSPVFRELLATKTNFSSPFWHLYHQLDPRAAVNLAVMELGNNFKSPAAYRRNAMHILFQTTDRRRLEIFRRVLRGELEGDVLQVVTTARDQYLIELGPELVEMMRYPDAGVRIRAAEAIEKLKEYAEAKKIFGDDGTKPSEK
ncbi:MAG: hypothetical protein V3T86_13775 [Planctomycetota bacterium]